MWEAAIIGRRSQGSQHLLETGLYSTVTRNLEENPPCNAEDNLRAELIVIEAWFRATEGVLDKGVSGQPDYRSIKTQDFGSCPDGTLLCVEDKLGDPDIIFPSL